MENQNKNEVISAQDQKQKRLELIKQRKMKEAEDSWIYATPLLGTFIPLGGWLLRHKPKERKIFFIGSVGFFLLHGFYLINRSTRNKSAY